MAKTGRPRDPSILEKLMWCPGHGVIAHRKHRAGKYKGVQIWRWVCPDCHNRTVQGMAPLPRQNAPTPAQLPEVASNHAQPEGN